MFRSRFFCVFGCMLLVLCSCTKTAEAKSKNQTEEKENPVVLANKSKVDAVVSKMSPRFLAKYQITDSNMDQFIKDLQEVLEEEKTFRKDDKSLFFLIDKKNKAESTYIPKDLIELKANEYFNLNKAGMKIRPEAYEALKVMGLAAQKDGIKLLVSSVYRSYEYQDNLFNYWVSVDGLEEAERESARPGTSQHQLGTAVDFGSISDDFDQTTMGRWMYEHAADYGWSLSFPKGYEDVTGYRWECWHFRYIGKKACQLQRKYFGDVQQFMLEFINEWKKTN